MGDISFCPAVLAEQTHFLSKLGVVCRYEAAVPDRTQVLCRVKTETAEITHRSYALALIRCTMSLGTVFDHSQAAPFGNRQDRSHFGGLTIKMDRHDRL